MGMLSPLSHETAQNETAAESIPDSSPLKMSITKTRANDIEQQLAQLRWRRMQNERAIKHSLESTKILKQKDTILGLTVDQSSERTLWMNSVVRDELSRPLVISDEELHNVQYEDHKIKKRLKKYSQMQLENVDKLQHTLENRVCRTVQGEEIRQEQLKKIAEVKVKLAENLEGIEQRKPYINVKHVVAKLF